VPRKIESLFIPGPAGRLEALLEEPEDEAPVEAALVCHPHPQHGGTMHNKVVYRLARGLRHAGFVVLRFNYRGVNLSEGVYDEGEGEFQDARACLAYLRARYPQLPYTLAGFSFGSRIVLRIGCSEPGARRVIAAGFPTIYPKDSFLDTCQVPRIFVQSTHDRYAPVPEIEKLVRALPEPKTLVFIEAQDHFFAGALPELEEQIRELTKIPVP
jgi:alpha/beta superfamily hydrolase